MRLIRRVLLLAIVVGGGVVALNAFSNSGWPSRLRSLTHDAEAATAHAARLASRTADKAGTATSRVGGRMNESAITAKIKSKMALDDHVRARRINVDTTGSVVALSGVVASTAERARALDLARDTEGVSRVIDRLQVRKP